LQKIYYLTYEKNLKEFIHYISREKEFNILNSNKHIKIIQENIRNQEFKKISNQEEQKRIEGNKDDIKI